MELPERKIGRARQERLLMAAHRHVRRSAALPPRPIFAVVTRGGLGGLGPFAHLAPLPLMIVALGFGLVHGATAALLGDGASVDLAASRQSAWATPGSIAAPAWLAVDAASGAPARRTRSADPQPFADLGALAPAAFLAMAIILWLVVATISFGSLDEALNPIRARAYILLDNDRSRTGARR